MALSPDMLALARGQITPEQLLARSFKQLGVHESHRSPVCVEKYMSVSEGGYVITFQCPACGEKSSNDGLSQPCTKAQSRPEQLPPWGNWQTED